MIPFFGTAIGSSGVFLMKNRENKHIESILSALAGGIMTAASVWSLILPSLDMNDKSVVLKVIETSLGLITGVVLMIIADRLIDNFSFKNNTAFASIGKDSLTQFIAVTLHNIPEGMAVGVVYAMCLINGDSASFTSAIVLSLGIAAQNIPEGAIISMPLNSKGMNKRKSFVISLLSGVVEPLGALGAIVAFHFMSSILPFSLNFAAGAMIYVVISQLIPNMYECGEKKKGLVSVLFITGFIIMMSLDIIFG